MSKYNYTTGAQPLAMGWGSAIIRWRMQRCVAAYVYGVGAPTHSHRRDYSDSDARAVAEWLNERERGYAPKTAYDHRRTP